MELLQLYYFEKIAKYQSFTKAAEELHVSQPSLSSCVIRLETELGAKLFDRSGRKIVLNSYGRYFLNMTRQILSLVNECRVPMNERAMAERINVGFMNYNETMFSIIAAYIRENPEISFHVHGSTLNEPFAYTAYDFIVGPSDEMVSPFHNELTVESQSAYVIVPKNHPLAEKETLTLGELKDESFCFLRDEKGGYEKEYRECIMNGFLPKCEFVTTNAFYKLRYVMENEVFGFVPSSWKDVYERCADVVLIPQAGKQNEVRCKLGWSDMTLNSETNRKFLEFVKERLSGEQPG